MPIGSKHICPYPGCNRLTRQSHCEKHRRHTDNAAPIWAARGSAHDRGYDRAWRRLRRAYVAEHPLCEIRKKCNGDPVAEVDHIIPLNQGGERLDPDNLQSACRRCHSWKTRNVDAQRQAKRRN